MKKLVFLLMVILAVSAEPVHADSLFQTIYNNGSSSLHSRITLDSLRQGLVMDIHAAELMSPSGSGLDAPDNSFAWGLLDSTRVDAATGASPRPYFGLNRKGQIIGETVNYIKQQLHFIGDVDTELVSDPSTKREGGDFSIYAGNGFTGWRAGTVRIYGGKAGAPTGNGQNIAGGVVLDAGDTSNGLPNGNSGNFGQQDGQYNTGDIQIGMSRAQRVGIGHPAMVFGTVIYGGLGGIWLETPTTVKIRSKNNPGGTPTIDYTVVDTNPDGYSHLPEFTGLDALRLQTYRSGGNFRKYRLSVNRAQTGLVFQNITDNLDLFAIRDNKEGGTWQPEVVTQLPLRLNTTGVSFARPVASAVTRGTFWVKEGAEGVADEVQVVLKSVTNTYSW